MRHDERTRGKEERDREFVKAKTRAGNEAEGKVRGSAQMVSCQRPAVRVSARLSVCVQAVHMCACCMYVECISALAFLCASMHVSLRVCRCPLS